MAKSLNFFCSKSEKISEKKNKKFISSGIFILDTKIDVWEPCQRFLQKIQNSSKLLKKNFKPKIVHLNTQRVVLTTSWSFFGQKSENISLEIGKNSEKESLRNSFFRKFYPGHVDRILRTMPKVSPGKPKRFKTFESFFKPKIVRLHTQKLVLTTSWSFLSKNLKFFSLKIRKKSEKNKKIISSGFFTLNTKIDVWEPLQNFLQKIQNVSNLYKKISSHKMFLWTLRR